MRSFRRGLVVSLVLHVGAVTPLAFICRSHLFPGEPAITVVAALAEPSVATIAANEPPRIVTETSQLTAELVQASLNEWIGNLRDLPPGQQLERLDRMTRQLDSLSSARSVDEMTTHFYAWFGLKHRAAEPSAQRTDSPFDFDTAQLHDVKRVRKKDGSWRYIAVLLDAAGRTLEVVMAPEDGEQAYALMQRLRAHPLLEKLYRQIAMPLLDRLIKTSRSEPTPRDRLTETP